MNHDKIIYVTINLISAATTGARNALSKGRAFAAAHTFHGTTMTSPLNLDEEARLYTNNAEREKYTLLATLFGIIVSLDYLERAYVRDSVTAAEYVHSLLSVGLCYVSCGTLSIWFVVEQEVFSGMYAFAVTVQDYAEVGRGGRAVY